tara:strand:- start:470 stop:1735 length:1266 start_codon:yes stop_codon:yes gene_type:complete
MSKKVSIIIRGKNEEDWLGLCLQAVKNQKYKNIEIIYVDNESDDASVQIAKEYGVNKVKSIKKFLPGNAINLGIKNSTGELIVILSAHCIPYDRNWLSNLVNSVKAKNIAGAYGRQLPLKSTSSDDARDLLITFGNESRIQNTDPFFHNANSIIKKCVWKKIQFDDYITNIEDRDWAKKVLNNGYKIKYDSTAAVYHFHGLHQHNNYSSFRASAVNNLIQKIDNDKSDLPPWLEIQGRKCPVVFYGNAKGIKKNIGKYFDSNRSIEKNVKFFYYGLKDPKIKNIKFLKRKVTRRAAFNRFTKDILDLVNKKIGYGVEGVAFVDLTYINFIKDSYIKNKEKVFSDNVHLSTFAYIDKGDIWTKNGNQISPIKQMFDGNTQFLRVAFGQSSILRSSSIRIRKSNVSDGFAYTFSDIKYLIRSS